MPLYDYWCRECDTVKEIFHGMQETPRIVCESCGNGIMERVILSAPHGHVVGTTLGSLADRNSSQMSDDERKTKLAKQKTVRGPDRMRMPEGAVKEELPQRVPQWFDKYSTKKDNEVAKMTPERQKQYIVEGT